MKKTKNDIATVQLVEVESPERIFTEEQKNFIHADKNLSIILKATAGSGKTASAIERVKFLLSKGVSPEKIIFFSYTNTAVETFKNRLNNDKVEVRTIHSFCCKLLSKMGKYKEPVDIYKFIDWYKMKFKPANTDLKQVKDDFYDFIAIMYDDAQYIGSEITAFKLQKADGIKCAMPKFLVQYNQFTKETKSRDFSDMLIEVRDLLKEDKWLKMFKNKYDYILIDEFQDCSTIQVSILTALNSKHYIIIGDPNQSIYIYSNANANAVMSMIKKKRPKCVEMTLSINFRSKKSIVEYANKYSDLKAISASDEEGAVHTDILLFEDLINILEKYDNVAILVRTNKVIKSIEKRLLFMKFPFRYTSYFKKNELEDLKKDKARPATLHKINALLPIYKTADNIISFIENNQAKGSFCRTIHRSKGDEFPICVIVNSVSPELLEMNNIINLSKEKLKEISFDPISTDEENVEAKNVHYVSATRAINEVFFLLDGV